MIASILFVGFIAFALAQDPPPNANGQMEEDKYGIFDKVKKIVSGASISCNNKYISGPYLESVLCGSVVPEQYTQKLGITFGPKTPWCAALACAYRAMGCHDPTYRIEAQIIKATGRHEDCAVRVGLGADKCALLAKFIAKVPQPQGKKRAVKSSVTTYSSMTEEEREEARQTAAAALRAYYPEDAGLMTALESVVPVDSTRKRNGFVEELQVCSPLIATGLMLIEGQVNLPVNVSDHLGPCGTICNYAVCGLNILCASTAKLMLEKVNNDRKFSGVPQDKCPPLSCANFIEAPPNQCEGVQCPVPDGHYTVENCPPPMQIYTPLKTSPDDCCTRCDNPCGGVNCPALNCPPPSYPSCVPSQAAKYDQYDCCQQCIDPCYAQRPLCPPEPQSCPEGSFLGPASPGACCNSCQPKCVGMSCNINAQSCGANEVFDPPKDNPQTCADCCGKCVGGADEVGASHPVAAFFAAAAVGAAASL